MTGYICRGNSYLRSLQSIGEFGERCTPTILKTDWVTNYYRAWPNLPRGVQGVSEGYSWAQSEAILGVNYCKSYHQL